MGYGLSSRPLVLEHVYFDPPHPHHMGMRWAGAGAGDWGGGVGGAGQESVNPDKGTAKWDSDKCVLEVSPGRRRRRRRRRLYRAHGGGGEGRLPGS